MSSFVKILFDVPDDDLKEGYMAFWNELASTNGWKQTGYGDWSTAPGHEYPTLHIIAARGRTLGCRPDVAEMVLRVHGFKQIPSILGHESHNTLYFRAPDRVPPAVNRSLLPSPNEDYPTMFKVILGRQPTDETVFRMGWQAFWYKFTEKKIWKTTKFTQFSFQHNTVWVTTPDSSQEMANYTLARMILQEYGFTTTSPPTDILPEFHSPAEIPDLTKDEPVTNPRSESVLIMLREDAGSEMTLNRRRLREFLDRLITACQSNGTPSYSWHFSSENEVLLSAKSDITSFSQLNRHLGDNGFKFVGHRSNTPAFEAPLKVPEFHQEP